MSLKDGTWPEYTKIDFSETEPEGYWDRSAKCKACGICWPNMGIFKHHSLCCAEKVDVVESPPDFKWKEAIRKLQQYRFDFFYQSYMDDLNEEEQIWLGAPLEIDEKIVEKIMNEIDNDLNTL